MIALCAVGTLILLPAPAAAAETCDACRYLDRLEMAGDPDLSAEARARLDGRPLASVGLGQGAFCEAGPGAQVAADLTRAADRQFARAEAIAEKVDACPQTCAPKLGEAEYCTYRGRLVADRYRLGAVALRLADLATIYARAGERERLPIAVLAADMTLYGGEALNVLNDALKAIGAGDPGLVHEVRWQASSTEISGLAGAIALLADLSLIEGDAVPLEAALERAAAELATLRDELMVALTRARLMQPAERRALETRIWAVASDLAWAAASLQNSAEVRAAMAETAMSTDANAVPPGRALRAIQAAVGCLNQLSLSAFTGSEAPAMAADLLNDCRSFEPCAVGDPGQTRADASPLRALLDAQDETERLTAALVGSMCAAN